MQKCQPMFLSVAMKNVGTYDISFFGQILISTDRITNSNGFFLIAIALMATQRIITISKLGPRNTTYQTSISLFMTLLVVNNKSNY